MTDCVFCKIARHEISKDFIYEDENIMVFADIHPIKPIHLLIVPKKHIKDFLDLEDDELATELIAVTQKMIQEQKLENKGYRLVVNGGGAQIIDHFHIHLTAPWGKAATM